MIFDVKEAKIAKTLSAPDDKMLFTAGRDRLVMYSPIINQFRAGA